MQTQILAAFTSAEEAAAVERATALLRAGEPVALPTETVYGLAADALNAGAVLKVFEAKERPRFDPLIVHLPERDWLERVAVVGRAASDLVARLTSAFWPGPLTLVLPRAAIVPDLVTAGLATVAVRMSAHPVFAKVARLFGKPLAAPSANRFGRISPTAAEHVWAELEGRIALIVDCGPTLHGIESTVVALREGKMQVLRPGPITPDALAAFGEVETTPSGSRIESPGQLPVHYAPRTPLVLVNDVASFAPPQNQRCALLSWKFDGDVSRFREVRKLSASGDLREAAANLFRCLRELDQSGVDLIVAEKVPDEGIGAAVLDRLNRAAARRPAKPVV